MNSLQARRPSALAITSLENYLLGTWNLSREVVHSDGRLLRFDGTATIEQRSDQTLSYFEQVSLTSGDTPLNFTRRYSFRPTGAMTASVEFEDGSFFYDLDLRRGRCRVEHLCDRDHYAGLILASRDGWYTRWRCQGPDKQYIATTYLSNRSPLPDRTR